MAEEQDAKQIPKTALIKHQKNDVEEKKDVKQKKDKKMVVVVKKKVVKVIKRAPSVIDGTEKFNDDASFNKESENIITQPPPREVSNNTMNESIKESKQATDEKKVETHFEKKDLKSNYTERSDNRIKDDKTIGEKSNVPRQQPPLSNDNDRNRNFDQNRDQNRNFNQNRGYDQNRDQNQNRNFDQNRDQNQNRNFDQNRDQNQNRGYDQNRDQNQNRGYDQNRDQNQNRGYDQNRDQNQNRGYDQNRNRPYDQNRGTNPPRPYDPNRSSNPPRPYDPNRSSNPPRPYDPNRSSNSPRPYDPNRSSNPPRPYDPNQPRTFDQNRDNDRNKPFKRPFRPIGNKKPGVPIAPAAKSETDDADKRKMPGRKFFKAKKKESYPKKKFQDREEKMLQMKKKQIHKASPVPKEISIMEAVTVSDLARKMNLKANELIQRLMGMGMMVTINQQIDAETATILADDYHCKVNTVSLYDETLIQDEADIEEDLESRPPIVTVMGHVDHGKTKLLDAIRATNVVDSEFGGITQHIGAYAVEINGRKIVFLDTPGHEAFTLMRARGAQVTDIVILIVAANDGVMPQTIEAINHAKDAKVPIIVAINKIDLPDSNIEQVKKQLSEYNLIPEEWGGNTLFCEVSALKKIGIKELLDSILLQTEIMELKASYKCRASGRVIESKIDFGRGIVATVLIQKGVLRVGDSYVAGIYPGKVRALFDDKGNKIDELPPGLPAEILGFTGIPDAGDPFQATENEKIARGIGMKRQELKRLEDAKSVKKVTLDNLYDKIKEGELKELKVIIKGDVHGSVEALKIALEKLSTNEIRLVVINALAGAINESDVMLAAASSALLIGFHVRPTPKAQVLAEREKVEIRKYNIIYDAIADIEKAMEGLLSPVFQEETIGSAEVRKVFKVPKIGTIGGCYVLTGKIKRNCEAHVIRDGIDIHQGKITSLKRFKDDAREVETSFECGIGVDGFNDLHEGDIIEAIEIKSIAQVLGKPIKDGKAKSKTN